VSVQLRRWTRDEFHRLAALGVLGEDDRVQLVDGEIVEMAPPGPRHVAGVHLVAQVLRPIFADGFMVRIQSPVAAGAYSEPEPDVAVVPGGPRDYLDDHPATAVLVVEVSDSTLGFDRQRKGPVYAAAGIPEYWILNLQDRVVEVYRDPGPDAGGHPAYRTSLRFGSNESLAPAARPGFAIAVEETLP
jgi:Uma2 family endonuclease